MPELHIPEGCGGLPLLDISLGGTVTIADQAPGGLMDTGGSHPTLREQLAAAAHSPPPTSSDLSHKPPLTSSPISLNSGAQDTTSTDKLVDITLGNCDSNSSFSSKYINCVSIF